jgi:hypothetical protein
MDFDPGKIPDPSLKSFAEGGDPDEPRSIIVELAMELMSLAPRDLSRRPQVPLPARPDSQNLMEIEGHADSMRRLESELNALGLGSDLVRLSVAQSFVVSATPAQLRALSQLPLVGVVRPNRTHRVPFPR